MSDLPELAQLEGMLERLNGHARTEVIATVDAPGRRLPIYAVTLGSARKDVPTFALVGGVHGLERIGTEVVLAYMHMLTEMLDWDELLRASLERMRVVFVPLVNPWGVLMGSRSNPCGVDLMRNAPVHPDGRGTFLVGGQRWSPRLPWYCGNPEEMEVEARALCDVMEREVLTGSPAIAVDVHSGFGVVDRVWFPYARTRRPFPNLPELFALKSLLDQSLPNHVYRIEPQSQSYTVDGDLWDYLYDRHQARGTDRVFLPLTLEMGSWLWVKKNPRQIFDRIGGFHPMKPHRLRRTLRRHLPLFDFLRHAAASPGAWAELDSEHRSDGKSRAFELWYAR